MTELEKMKQERIKIKGDKKMRELEKMKLEREQTLAAQQIENAAVRRQYLAKLAAEKAEKQAERDRAIDTALEPEKKRLQNQWLVDHPGKTESDFNKEAWHLLKENLVEQGKAEAVESELQRLMASGRYSL